MSFLPKSAIQALSSGGGATTIGGITGLQDALNAKQPTGSYITGNQTITLSGDLVGSGSTTLNATLATVNSNTGTFGGAQTVPQISVDGKGRITGVTAVAISATINDTNAQLRDRQTHTGEQAQSTVTGLVAALAAKQASGSYEPAVAAGTITQYYRGDKTWQTLPSAGGGALPTLYTLAAAHANNTITPTTIGSNGADTDWVHTLVAGKVYRFTIFCTYQTPALTTGGRMNLLGGAGLAGAVNGMMWGGVASAAAASTLEVPIYRFDNNTGSFLLTTAVNPINVPHIWGADFVFVCTTGGTLSLQWASEVAASLAQMNVGSTMMVELLN